MKFFLALITGLLLHLVAAAQLSAPLVQLQQHLLQDSVPKDSLSTLNPLYNSKGLHYLQPVSRQLKKLGKGVFPKGNGQYTQLAQDLAFAGDYTAAAQFGRNEFDSMAAAGYQDARNYIDTIKSLQFRNARNYILSRADSEQVIMINETRYMPQHRAFTTSLLKELYQKGFRYFATDLLNNRSDRRLSDVDMRTGYFAAEPVAGEMLRQAIALGFTLVAYEDTLADNHSGTGRDAIQAARIAAIFQRDPSAKVLVHAGQAHICEGRIGQSYTPMAVAFRRFTGINPFTIDQTELTPGSTFEYGRYFYMQLQPKLPADGPVIAFRNNQPRSLLENELYDVQLIHTPATEVHSRPGWLSFSGARKAYGVQPTEKKLFFVQAFYQQETTAKPLTILVSADQTYQADRDGYYWLFLYPGKYTLIFRDMDYQVLAEKEIEVPG